MPQTIALSAAAAALLRLHFADRGPRVDDSNREAYRELGEAGLMEPLHSFAWGRESNYRLTKAGAECGTGSVLGPRGHGLVIA